MRYKFTLLLSVHEISLALRVSKYAWIRDDSYFTGLKGISIFIS